MPLVTPSLTIHAHSSPSDWSTAHRTSGSYRPMANEYLTTYIKLCMSSRSMHHDGFVCPPLRQAVSASPVSGLTHHIPTVLRRAMSYTYSTNTVSSALSLSPCVTCEWSSIARLCPELLGYLVVRPQGWGHTHRRNSLQVSLAVYEVHLLGFLWSDQRLDENTGRGRVGRGVRSTSGFTPVRCPPQCVGGHGTRLLHDASPGAHPHAALSDALLLQVSLFPVGFDL